MMWPSKHVRIISLCVAAILALPLPLDTLTGVYLWTSPQLMISMALAQHTLILLHVLAMIVLAAILLRHRWYCTWMCPTGVLCDAASNSRKAAVRLNRIPDIHKMLLYSGLVAALLGAPMVSILDPINIFHAFFDTFRSQPAGAIVFKLAGLALIVGINFGVPHLWCRKLCPLGGLQDVATAVRRFVARKSIVPAGFQANRRLALGTLGGFGLGLLLRPSANATAKGRLRPPGALPEEHYKNVCLRCGNCGKACPTGIIRSSFDSSDLLGLLTPQVVFAMGYCLPDCIACGSVCPSGAIRRFTQQDKAHLVMGIARIQRERCLLTEHKECDLCRRYCAFDAIVICTSDSDISAWPEIVNDRCTGCGACMVVCPVKVIEIRAA